MYAYFSKATLENKQFPLDSKRRSEQSIHILNENKRCRLSCFSSYSFHLLQTAVTPTWSCAPCRVSQQACRTPADFSQFLSGSPFALPIGDPFSYLYLPYIWQNRSLVMSLLAYIWQTIMRKTHFGGTFFRFSPLGLPYISEISPDRTRNLPYISEISLYFPANGQTKTYDVG